MTARILIILGVLSLAFSCASDPYPNDRNMNRMSVGELVQELSKP